MPEDPLQEAQNTLVKLFKDVYFKAGSPLSYKDELQVRSTVATLVRAIRQDVMSELKKAAPPAPVAARPEQSGDPFPLKAAPVPAAAAPAVQQKKGFFSGLVQSKIVPSPHKKK